MNNKTVLGIIVVLLLVGGAFFIFFPSGKGKNTPPTPKAAPTIAPSPVLRAVTLGDNGFLPSTIEIKAGETVSWTNRSGENASVNSDPHPTHNKNTFLNLGEFPSGTTVQTVFTKEGTYTYHNHLNPSQKGTVIVK